MTQLSEIDVPRAFVAVPSSARADVISGAFWVNLSVVSPDTAVSSKSARAVTSAQSVVVAEVDGVVDVVVSDVVVSDVELSLHAARTPSRASPASVAETNRSLRCACVYVPVTLVQSVEQSISGH